MLCGAFESVEKVVGFPYHKSNVFRAKNYLHLCSDVFGDSQSIATFPIRYGSEAKCVNQVCSNVVCWNSKIYWWAYFCPQGSWRRWWLSSSYWGEKSTHWLVTFYWFPVLLSFRCLLQYAVSIQRCYLIILNPKKIGEADALVARLEVPRHLNFPLGFHGFWDNNTWLIKHHLP